MNESPAAAQALRRYLAVLRRQWWVIVTVFVVAMALSGLFIANQQSYYAATTKIVVGQGRALFGPDVSFAVEPFTQTMTELLQSDVVAQRVIDDQDLGIDPSTFLGRLSVTSRPDTSVLQVSYVDTDPRRAVRVLEATGSTFTRLIDEGFAQPKAGTNDPGSADEPVSAVVFDPAHALPDRVAPKVMQQLVISALLALLAGAGLAFLRDALASRIRNVEEAQAAFGVPVIGALPPGVVGSQPAELELLPGKASAHAREALSMLGATVRFASRKDGFSSILVTSGLPEEGKTTVAANMSFDLARAGRRVVVVEADTRKPALYSFLGVLPDEPGLLDVMRGKAQVGDVLIDVPLTSRLRSAVAMGPEDSVGPPFPPDSGGQLLMLAAGRRFGGTPTILAFSQVADLLADLRAFADCVVFDSSPLLLAGDAFPLAQLADQVLVVCREGTSTRTEAEQVLQRLKSIGVEDFSLVVTESSSAKQEAYGYGYGYGS